jgi:hypothetical protein
VKEGLVVTGGKAEGATPGFTVRDAKGDRYLLKLDDSDYPELGSSSEVISTKILYAVGYHVPENYVVYFDPERLRVAEKATLDTGGEERAARSAPVTAVFLGETSTPAARTAAACPTRSSPPSGRSTGGARGGRTSSRAGGTRRCWSVSGATRASSTPPGMTTASSITRPAVTTTS